MSPFGPKNIISKETEEKQLPTPKTQKASDAAKRDYAGLKFGRLTALRPLYSTGRRWVWEFKCDCGNSHIMQARHAVSGRSKSCGCLYRSTLNQWRASNPNWTQIRAAKNPHIWPPKQEKQKYIAE